MKSDRNIASPENRAGRDGTGSHRLTGEQLGAIRLAAEVGDDIRKTYPVIAEDYRSGLTAPKIAARYGLDDRYGVSRQTAIYAVRHAIRGYSGNLYEPYQGLVADRSEREHLAFAHNRQTGTELYQRKLGIHALTQEQRAEAGRKGGLIRGPLSYRLRIGCHALPSEVLRELCRRIAPLGGKAGGVASVLAQGLVPYTPAAPGRVAEIEFAFGLATDPHYLGPVRANFKMIAEKVNEVFHGGNPRYTRTTLKIALQRRRRRGHSAESISDPEMSFAEELACTRAYQLPARMNGAEIARMANEKYHGGKPVRNPLSIRSAIQRYRRQSVGLTATQRRGGGRFQFGLLAGLASGCPGERFLYRRTSSLSGPRRTLASQNLPPWEANRYCKTAARRGRSTIFSHTSPDRVTISLLL